MKCIVKTTPRYDKEAKLYSCTNVIERFRKMAEGLGNFKHNTNDEYGFDDYLRKEHKNFRTIFIFKNLKINGQDMRCYLALRVFKRSDSEYHRFHQNTTPKTERDIITGLSSVDWARIRHEIESELKKNLMPAEKLPLLSIAEEAFIQRENGITQEIFDTPIYESKQWVETVRRKDFGDPFKVAEALEDKIYEITIDEKQEYGLMEIPYGDKGEKILCYRLREPDAKDGWFLLGLGTDEILAQLKAEVEQSIIGEGPFAKGFTKKCRRAYPLSMLEDKDFWHDMERDKDSNFILSDEEISIVSKPLKFPLFISGRAGSGKSTVLQYLFAEFFLRYISNEEIKPPVYLSYSDNLIENAKRLSSSLFKSNHAYTRQLKKINKSFPEDIEPKYANSFYVFQQLVRDCISTKNKEVLNSRFANGRRVSYSKYRELWNEKFGRDPKAGKEYGPALSWHVIRTYIKGWDSEAYCEPADYVRIGRGNKSVSDDVFKQVFDKVWIGWYQKLQEDKSLWDDQDLVRYCLAPDDDSCETCVSERFSAILCDESQDFTRIETEFILRLSIFSNRRIYNSTILWQLPFVFAGDEFQTLNPTGFSWDSLRSYFTERLIHSTELGAAEGAPDPVSLTRNYRSTSPIVKLGNRLQLLRQTRCGNNSRTVPQIPYYAENNADAVYCLHPNNPSVWKKLGEMGVVLIVPCADGQRPKDFIDASPIKGMIDFYEDGSPKNITVYNPIQAKGLDYPCVAIYGFDNIPALELETIIDWFQHPQADSETTDIELKYFLSNAYVSATRAKNKLFIISDFNKKSFWAFAFSSSDNKLQNEIASLEKLMMASLRNPHEWEGLDEESMLGYIIEGDINAVTNENIVNAGEVARITEERGISLHDAGLMLQAAARYRERGTQNDVVRCEAWAHRFERKYLEAACAFEKAQQFNDAVKSYWLAYTEKEKDSILKSIAQLKGKSTRLEVQFAEHATKSASLSLDEIKRALDSLVKVFSGESGDDVRSEAMEAINVWGEVTGIILEKIGSVTTANKADTNIIIKKCSQLEKFGINLNVAKQAYLVFAAGNFSDAIELWDRISQKPKEYYQAKASIMPYPENLPHWQSSGIPNWRQKVVEAWRADAAQHKLNEANSRIVANAICSDGTDDEVKGFLPFLLAASPNLGDGQKVIEVAEARKLPFAKECLDALLGARWSDLQGWSHPKKKFLDASANDLLSVVSTLKYVRSETFRNELNESLRDTRDARRRVLDFMDGKFRQFNRSVWNPILLAEVGFIMEKRGHFLDAQRYYDWATRQLDEPAFQKAMNIRWIACKERQAEKNKNAEDLTEAREKRKECGIPQDEVLPIEPTFDRWEWLFGEALKITPQEASIPAPDVSTLDVKPQSENVLEAQRGATEFNDAKATDLPEGTSSNIEPQSIPASDGTIQLSQMVIKEQTPITSSKASSVDARLPEKLFDYEVNGYKFRFNAVQSELSISRQAEDEDSHVKIRKGYFPDGADFVLKGNVLMKANGVETPFELFISKDEICAKIAKSGVKLIFPMHFTN